jgi:hypothetical protein
VQVAPNSRIPKGPFDRKQVEQFLEKWYESEMQTALRKPMPSAEAAKQGCSIFDIQPEMASTKAVRVLLDLTALLGFEPSKDVIKKGGYRSKAEFVKEVTGRIEEAVQKHYGGKPPAAVKPGKEVTAHAQL